MRTSLMEKVLGEQWQELPEVIRTHYDLPMNRQASVLVEGAMDIGHPIRAWPLIAASRLAGALVPAGRGVSVHVLKSTREGSGTLYWNRSLHYPDGRMATFLSTMEYIGENHLIEYTNHGIGIRMDVTVEEGELVYRSRGYACRRLSGRFTVPDGLLLGSAEIRERAISANQFELDFRIWHPLLGHIYRYGGVFTLSQAEKVAA